VELATGERAVAQESLSRAESGFTESARPVEAAETRLLMAEALVNERPDDAASLARAAHAAAVRQGVPLLRDRSAAVLRRLGASAPRATPATTAVSALTARETEILDGLRRGDSNATIAGRLFLSPKTIEHHVGRIFVKLGVRTRAEAAAVAAAASVSENG
jgi:DNA-binding NarL/FixJ family response regulator